MISPITAAAVRPRLAPEVRAAEHPQAAQNTPSQAGRPLRPARDEYIPEEKPKEAAERCTCNTDKVDRELEKLREKRAELEKQLASQTDEAKAGELARKLHQVENELRQKDNDAYRRQHAVFTEG